VEVIGHHTDLLPYIKMIARARRGRLVAARARVARADLDCHAVQLPFERIDLPSRASRRAAACPWHRS
jgi:hypothetical protein